MDALMVQKCGKMDHRFSSFQTLMYQKVNHNMGQSWYNLYYGISAISPSQWHTVFVKTDEDCSCGIPPITVEHISIC